MTKRKDPAYHLYRGLFTRIAERLRCSRSYVSRVASGERTSATVEAALNRELARIQARAAAARQQRQPARG